MKTAVKDLSPEATPVRVSHETNDAEKDLRRQAAAELLGKLTKNLDNGQPLDKEEATILAKTEAQLKTIDANSPEQDKVPEATGERLELHDAPVPTDSADYNFDELEAQARQYTELQPLRENVAERIGFTWTRKAGLLGNMAIWQSAREARYQARLAEKTKGMSEEERLAVIAKWEKRSERISKAAALTVGVALTAWTFKSVGYYMPLFGGHGGGSVTAMDMLHSTDQKGNQYQVELMNDKKPLSPKGIDVAIMEKYNNSDSSFYDFAHKAHRGDFGPALQASAKDGNFGPGFADWMSRNQHEPNGLANLVSGLKLDGHGDNLADRNGLANIYDNDKVAQIKADILVQNELRDPTKFSVETINIDFPYKTTYMVDVNGDPVIAMQEYTDHGGEAFKIINKQTGEVTYWRKNCGAYQQIWPLERASRPTYSSTYAPRGGGSSHHYQSTPAPRPVQPSIPGNPGTPGTPEIPGTPGIPGIPEVPEVPVETDEAKDYSGGVDTAPGIDPNQNTFQGWTPDPIESGNGTGSPNLAPQVAPGSESAQQAPAAAPNTHAQVATPEAGAGTNRTAENLQKIIRGAQDFMQQQRANSHAADMDKKMSDAGNIGDAIRKAQADMGADGRPLN